KDFADFAKLLQTYAPELLDGFVWFESGGWRFDFVDILEILVGFAWSRHERLDADEKVLAEIVDEFAESLSRSTVRTKVVGVISGFRLVGASELRFPDGLRIRPITDEEATRFYGGDWPEPRETLGQ